MLMAALLAIVAEPTLCLRAAAHSQPSKPVKIVLNNPRSGAPTPSAVPSRCPGVSHWAKLWF
jgi:hypothetical protein